VSVPDTVSMAIELTEKLVFSYAPREGFVNWYSGATIQTLKRDMANLATAPTPREISAAPQHLTLTHWRGSACNPILAGWIDRVCDRT
jgi:hypothetical protein